MTVIIAYMFALAFPCESASVEYRAVHMTVVYKCGTPASGNEAIQMMRVRKTLRGKN